MRLQEGLGAVRRERVLPADREATWELLADPGALEGWLADEVELEELAEGAEGVFRWRGGAERRVVVEEVEDARRLAFRWEDPRGDEPDTLVELTLEDHEDGTLLRVVELPLVVLHAYGAELPVAAGGAGGGPLLVAA